MRRTQRKAIFAWLLVLCMVFSAFGVSSDAMAAGKKLKSVQLKIGGKKVNGKTYTMKAGDSAKLEEAVPGLLERYRAIGEELTSALGDGEADLSDEDLPEIGEEELKEAFTAIGEFVSVADSPPS